MSAPVVAPVLRSLGVRVLAARRFSEAGAVALALVVAVGAVLARPVPPPLAVALLLVGLVGRRAWVVALGLALLASALAAAAWAGAAPASPGRVDAPVTLLSDPEPVPGGVRAVVRAPDRSHLEVTARGRAAAGLRPRLAGEVVHVVGPREPRPDAADWLRQRHVVGTVDATAVRPADAGSLPARAANALRRLLTDGAAVLPADQQALFTGLVFGDDRAESPAVTDDFRASGLTHLLAVSGENVAFVLVAAGPVLRRLGPRSRGVAAVAVLVFFAFATRFEPSVLRATAMALVATATTTFGAPISARRTLALAVTALLLIDPFLVASVGFQLSVAASAGIIVLARPIERRLPGPRAVAELLGVTLAAQVGVAPVLIPVFGGLPLVSLPANLLAVPAAGPVMVWGLTGGILAGVLGAPLALVVHAPTRLLLGWIAGVARVAAAAPIGALDGRAALVLAVLAAVIGIVRWLTTRPGAPASHAVRRSATVVTAAAATAMAVVVGVAAFGRPGPAAPRIELGAGAALHVAGEGSAVLVLDGRARLDRVLDGLRQAGARRLLLVVQRTRSGRLDADVALLRSRVQVDRVLRPGDQGGASASDHDAAPPLPGDQVVAGDLVVSVDAVEPALRVSVGPRDSPSDEQGRAPGPVRARAPPARGPRCSFAPVSPLVPPPVSRMVPSGAPELALGPHRFDITHRAVVMGILNRTPDSFYDKGSYWAFDSFLAKAEQLVADGADFLDVGGVKAGPGEEVTEEQELDRVVPAVEALHERFDLPLSIDTWRASVARACYAAGAVVGNDISGFADPDYLSAAAEAGASVVATHIRLAPRVPDPDPVYDDVVLDVRAFLADRAAQAEACGIPRERIMVDAGLDLGKSEPQSLTLLRASETLASLGYPVFLSASNKRFLWNLLGVDVGHAANGTLAAHALGIALGCRVLRSHDARGARRVADTMAAILEAA